MNYLFSLAGISLLVASCTATDHNHAPPVPGPAGEVTRTEAIAIARAYVDTAWLARSHHQFHGKDSARIEIQTPDHHEGTGWWKIDHINFGVPYKWGGFDTPQSFLTGLKKGKYAGDISTPHKRRKLEAAVSREAVGIDCSGLVSRAWRLKRAYSTRELPDICDRLASWDDLQAGDILNRPNAHVVMFLRWKVPGRTFFGIEAGPYSGWRVTENLVRANYLRTHGYVPLRYKHIREDGAERTAQANPTLSDQTQPTSLVIKNVRPPRTDKSRIKRRIGGLR